MELEGLWGRAPTTMAETGGELDVSHETELPFGS